jgi:hypothetical protein
MALTWGRHLWSQMKMKREMVGRGSFNIALMRILTLHSKILHFTLPKTKFTLLGLIFFPPSFYIHIKQNLKTTFWNIVASLVWIHITHLKLYFQNVINHKCLNFIGLGPHGSRPHSPICNSTNQTIEGPNLYSKN